MKKKITITKMKNDFKWGLSAIFALFIILSGQAQNPCPSSPSVAINLTGQPSGVISTSNIVRTGTCCGVNNPADCIYFLITLDPNSAGIIMDQDGANPPGSLTYSYSCGGASFAGGTIKCLAGVGPHQILQCKPGGNGNVYTVRSISKPTFPPDTSIRIGCSIKMNSQGFVNNTATWTAVNSANGNAPATLTLCNSYLDSLNVARPTYSPGLNAPAWVQYSVCAMPQATACGYALTACSLVTVYNYSALGGNITPDPASFCNVGGGSGVLLTASITGGQSPYTYTWSINPSTVSIGTGSTYFAQSTDLFKVKVYDNFYNPLSCPAYTAQRSVLAGTVPVVIAGPSKTVCASNPLTPLTSTVQFASPLWSTNGDGTFPAGTTATNTSYMPGPNDLATGSVVIVISSTNAGGGCSNSSQSLTIHYSRTPTISISSNSLSCFNNTVAITSTVTGGIIGGSPVYSYTWNNGATTSSTSGGPNLYSLIVSDQFSCSSSASYSLNAPSPLSLSFGVTNVTINGGNDGSATVTPSGGNPGYTYNWSTGSITPVISTQTYGVKSVTVTDANGCTIIGSAVINEPRCLGFTALSLANPVSCYGYTNGIATVTASGGIPGYTYSWSTSPVQTAATATGLAAGVYSVLITDSNVPSCFQTANVTITQPTVLTNVMTQTNVSSQGGNDGAAMSNPAGGTGPYTYNWSNGLTSQGINTLTAGIYSVTITDNRGCNKSDAVNITQPPCNNLIVNVIVTNPQCNGGFGSAVAVITGAVGSPSITWSNGVTGPSSGTLLAGNYSVTVNQGTTCSTFKNFSVLQPSPLQLGLLPTNVRCYKLRDGTIDLTLTGGTIPYSYTWTAPSYTAYTEDIVGLSPNTYTVNVSDANGCTSQGVASITEPSQLTSTFSTSSITCNSYSNGAITALPNGGVFPYVYSWSTGANTQSIGGLNSAGYSYTVTDANNCVVSKIVGLTEPDSVKAANVTIACSVPGSSVAQVVITPTGGISGTYSISFDNGGTYLPAGVTSSMLTNGLTYSVMIQDGNGCLSPLAKIVSIPNDVLISSVTFTNCFALGTTTTVGTVSVNGGDNGPYAVSINNGGSYALAGTNTFVLNVGSTYSIIAKDGRNCVSGTTVITVPSVFDATTSVTSNYNGQHISCATSTNGVATVTTSGGTSPFTYSWTTIPTQTTSTANNLGANNYSVTVTDANGCVITRSIAVVAPPALTATAVATSNFNGVNVSCFGYNDGTASVTVNGGTGAYSYNWTTVPSQTTATAGTLIAGPYTVQVTDANGCNAVSTVTLTQPASINSTISIISNFNGEDVSCYGATNASITITATNGTSPFTYTWSTSPPQTGTIASNVGAGTYSVIVTDVNGCQVTPSITVTQPSSLVVSTSVTSNYNGQNVSCFGSTNGSASVTTSGGTGAYTYSWSTIPAQLTASANTLGAGNYSVLVTDANGCNITGTVALTQPTAVAATASVTSNWNGQDISCFSYTNGSASVTATGGTGAYTYSWSTVPTQTMLSANNLGANNYTVLVTDANSCTVIATVSLTQPPVLTATAAITSNWNGQDISCFGYNDGTASVTVNGGTGAYYYNWTTNPTQTTATAGTLSAGPYTVQVTDDNGCTAISSVTLTQPAGVLTTLSVTSDYNGQQISCFGASDASIVVTATNGTSPYTFTWTTSPPQTGTIAINVSAGNYSVVTEDANGCLLTSSITVTQPSSLVTTMSITSDYNGQNISCFGLTDGSASVTATGGTGAYTYSWTTVPTQTNAAGVNLGAGAYSVTVTDVNGCNITNSVTLTQPAALIASLTSMSNYNGFNVSCFGSSNGNVDINVSGGNGALTYTWSNLANTQDINNITAGGYTVIVNDINACADTLSVTVTEPTQLVITIDSLSRFNGFNTSCNGVNNGTIFTTVSGGVPTYINLWSNGTSNEDLNNVNAGSFTMSVVDLNNCSVLADTVLIEPPAFTFTSSVSEPLCNGVANGSINVTVGGGVSPFTYNWSNNTTNEDLDNISAGTYTINYTDKNGCKDSVEIKVNQPQSITYTKEASSINCFKDTTAKISLYINGGTLPYKYNWSNGDTTKNITNVGAGSYIVTITDAKGCIVNDTTNITQPDSLYISLYSPQYTGGFNISTYGGSDGAIDLTVNGGTSPFNYLWSNGSTSQNQSNLGTASPVPTKYYVTVTDAKGCKVTGDIVLTQPLILEMPTAYSPNNDGKNDFFVVHGIEAYSDNMLTIFNRWGNIVYTKSTYNNEWDGKSKNGQELPDGTYFAILEINKGEIVLKGYVELRR